jgi:hypothetical protein
MRENTHGPTSNHAPSIQSNTAHTSPIKWESKTFIRVVIDVLLEPL